MIRLETHGTENGFPFTLARELPTANAHRLPLAWWTKGRYISRRGATEVLDHCARAVAFAEAAGLVYAPSKAAYRAVFRDWDEPLCSGYPDGFDHTETWRNGRGYLATTEPYHGPAEVMDWCRAHGAHCAYRPEWGMWNPPHTHLVIVSRDADLLESVLARLDAQ